MPYWQARLSRPGGGVMVLGVSASTQQEAARKVFDLAGPGMIIELTCIPSVKERLKRSEDRLAGQPTARRLWEQKKLEGN